MRDFDTGFSMPTDDPVFSVRSIRDGTYIIDVVWPDRATEQLGYFTTPDDAIRWIEESSEMWLRDRLGIELL
jgi:hypothetical protein